MGKLRGFGLLIGTILVIVMLPFSAVLILLTLGDLKYFLKCICR